MADFLSDEWLDELEAAMAAIAVAPEVRVTLQQVVADGEAERAYALRFADGRITLVRGRVADADITFSQDRSTAAAIARGEQSAQAAFLQGHLRIGGDLHRFAEPAEAVAGLGDVFASVRATTTY